MKDFAKREKKNGNLFYMRIYVLNIFYMIYTGCNMKKKHD